jgi:hypothetical protein
MSARIVALLLAGVFAAGCRRDVPTVHQTSSGQLVLGEAEVLDPLDRTVAPGGRTLVFEGFNGTIDLSGSTGADAVLRFTRRARGSDDGDATETLEGVTVTEAGDAASYRYTMRASDPSLTAVDVRGTVPYGTSLRIRLATGTVAIRQVAGPVTVQIENGTVEVDAAAAPVDVRARNGTLDVEVATLGDGAPVSVETSNGAIALAVPATANAAVEAATRVGTVTVEELPFTERRLTPEGAGVRFGGQLGRGGTRVVVQTSNGAIVLRPAAPPPDRTTATPPVPVRRDSIAPPLPPVRDTGRTPAPAPPDTSDAAPAPQRPSPRAR